MDDFAVDLDKVLDDFELSEGGTSGTKPDPKLNHGHNLPALQPPVSGGGLYNSSQGVPLPPVYTQNNTNNANYRQHPSYNTQFDLNYQAQSSPGDYTFPQTHNPIIRATVQPDARGDVFPTSKPAVLNNQLDLTCNADRLPQTSLPHMEPQHNDTSSNPQWSTLVNNNMTPYALKYGTEGGVLAHGERSNSNIVRRLSDDRPELLQSMEEKPTSLPPYPGELNTSQGYPGGSNVSHVRPDVVPVSLSNGHDVRNSQPTSMEFQNDLGADHTYSKDQLNLNLAQDSSISSLSNGDLQLSLSQPEKPINLHLNNAAISTAQGSHPISAPEYMNVDSPPHSLQSEQSSSSPDRTIDSSAVTPTSVASNATDHQTDSPMCLVANTSANDNTQPQMLASDVPDRSDSTVPQEEPASTQRLPTDNVQQAEPVTVGFSDIQVDDITEDDMDAYLATVEASDGEQAPTATAEPQLSCPSSLSISSSIPQTSTLDSGDERISFSRSDSQGSGGIVERFLAPSLASPRIATPMDDPGFSKVPGYVPSIDMSSLQEVPTLREDEEEKETEEQPSGYDSDIRQSHQEHPAVYTSVNQTITPVANSEESNTERHSTEPVVTDSNAPTQATSPQIGGDCVMTMDKEKGDCGQTISALGAITVSFPMQAKAQPVDTTNSLPDASVDASSQQVGAGARPKETSQNMQRKSRPNSLLGLSKPDLNITVPVSGYGEMVTGSSGMPAAAAGGCLDHAESLATGSIVENSHDIINRQLAQKSRSPLQKKQLNLEIKQQLDNAAAQRQLETKSLDNRTENDVGLVSVVTNRAQLASGVGLTLPLEGNPMLRTDSGFQEDITSSSSSSSLLSVQAPSPLRVINNLHTNLDPSTEDWQQQQQYQQQQPQQQQQDQDEQKQPEGGPSAAEDNSEAQGAKLKRPTSLSLMPRSEFQLSQDKDSTEDDSITGDGGYASSGSSSGHLTPFQGDNEMSEPAGATASGPGAELYSPPEVGPGAFSPAPRCSSNANVVITQLGKVAPRWVPDAEACNCMECEARFTFTKRRHHCRACGKVFCSACCNLKCKLQYMDNKEARVCSKCYQDIVRAQAYERMHSPNRSPNPNNPAEYCSTIPPLQQAAASLHAPPPTVMVPVGVLRKEGSQRSREPKQVMFSDGIRPGGDLTELDGSDARISIRRTRSSKKVERMAAAAATAAENSSEAKTKSPSPKTRVKRLSEPSLRHACLIPDTGLPPVIMSTGVKGDFTLEEDPNPETILPKIRSTEDPNPVVFAINKNLFVLVKIVNLDCCLNRVCWCFSTKGMCTVGQDEVVIVLECLPDEKTIPRDIFCHLNSVYDEASKGNTVSHLGHTIFGQSFLDSRDHCGFLYIRPTFQCVQKLLLPQPPYVFGLLLQRWETPWAKVFPVRLMLRLGAEYRYYPCPLISVRFRKPVYGEIGHTIMNLLADFRNYQYMLPQTRGVVVHMEEKKTFINFPRNRYEEVMKVITNSNDHVMALGANFSTDADSHLVCIQNEDGNYQTQAINIQNKPRKVTGASFVVFNGALKTSSGLRAKSSIVEDGLMVQITSESMAKLKAALLDMKDYTISCGSLDVPVPEEQVIIQWVEDDRKVNQGVKSPIDGLPMDGIESIHIHNGTDYVGERRTIRWTEVFFIQNEDSSNSRCEPVDLSRLAETLAQACCIALTPHLDKLREAGLTKLGLRCTIDRDNVGYEVGSNGEKLPDNYMNDLDNELIPVIHNAGSQNQDGPVVLELIFYIIE